MSAYENSLATLDSVAEELHERAANMRARSPHVNKVSAEEAALQLAILLIGEMQERKQPVDYATEYYAERMLHLVRWSGSNIGAGVMIEYLIHHGGYELDTYFHRLLEETGYQREDDLPEEMRVTIQRMKQEGRDPVESYKPNGNKCSKVWQCTAEHMHLIDELDSRAWPDLVALVEEVEARRPQLRNREVLIEELTTRLIDALQTNNLPMLRPRDWYWNRIATLTFHYAHPLFVGIITCLLLDNIESTVAEEQEEDKHACGA